uniref:PWWP domain-containing protein n=1 Tax=Haemonchus contortus TaxID=6289 RepID=A0A7I4XWU5_HAECO
MDMQSSSDSTLPKPGDLVWAKMKGFPPWPAKVLEKDKDTPLSRIPVLFFGTGEKAFMKASDLCDYYENKAQYEVPRKHKGFNEGVHEIRVAAGFETTFDADPLFGASSSSKCPSPMLSGTIQDKSRLGTGKMLADAFLSGFERRRANSGSTRSRSRASSSASALKKLHKAMHRRRLDSGSSAGSRRLKGIAGFNDTGGFDLFDSFQGLDGNDFNMLDGGLNLLANDDARSSRSKRSRASSKLYDDFLLNGFGTRSRHRSGSASEVGRRSRLISGVSDVFDELLFNGELNLQQAAEQLLHTLDELPSEGSEARPGTPEAPAPLPGPALFCTACGCECKLTDGKWRCTSKFCRKIHEPDSNAEQKREPALSSGPLTATMVKTEDKPLSKPVIGSDEKCPKVSQGKMRMRTEVVVKEEDEEDHVESSPFNARSAISLRRRQITSPVRKRARKEESAESSCPTSSKEPRNKTKALTPPREMSLFSPVSPQKSTTANVVQNNPDQRRHIRGTGRPRQYKVEKTPVMGPNGQRQCTFCSGQVRPQMCGSNKHRWRCVDKKCRKWYGWVKSHEEIPRDLGRKGRWNLAARTKKPIISSSRKNKEEEDTGPASLSSQAEAALAAAEIQSMRSDNTSDPITVVVEQNVQEVKKKLGRPPKEHGLKIRLKGVKEKKEQDTRQKRKYVRRRDKITGAPISSVLHNRSLDPGEPKPVPIPLTEAEKNYEPCAIEKRVRWWLSEKRRIDASPERKFETKVIDSCAAFRMLSHAFRATAVTRADEAHSVDGSLDILMDSLMGSLGPLLTLASAAFESLIPDELAQKLWNSSAVHLPTFQ